MRPARNVSWHPDGYMIRIMRNGKTRSAFIAGHSEAKLRRANREAARLRAEMPESRQGARTDLLKSRRRARKAS